jgi:precorrin-6B methylase 2
MQRIAKHSMGRLAGMHIDEGLLRQLGPDERSVLAEVGAGCGLAAL